jgi:hypothetical protein
MTNKELKADQKTANCGEQKHNLGGKADNLNNKDI